MIRIIWKSVSMSAPETLEFDTATRCDIPLEIAPTADLQIHYHDSFGLLRETRIFSHVVTEVEFLNMLNSSLIILIFLASVFDDLEYPRGQIRQPIDMTDPNFNAYFLRANTVDNTQIPDEGVLCRNSEYAVLTDDPIHLGNTSSIMFILKFDPWPTTDVWNHILKLEQKDNVYIYIYYYSYRNGLY